MTRTATAVDKTDTLGAHIEVTETNQDEDGADFERLIGRVFVEDDDVSADRAESTVNALLTEPEPEPERPPRKTFAKLKTWNTARRNKDGAPTKADRPCCRWLRLFTTGRSGRKSACSFLPATGGVARSEARNAKAQPPKQTTSGRGATKEVSMTR